MSRFKRRKKLRKIAELARCYVIHAQYPTGFTCLDQIAHATANPDGYGKEFRARIMRGEVCCAMCRIKSLALSGIGSAE